MSDPLRDPDFPDRPQHDDFWRLSSVVTKADGRVTEGGLTARDVASGVVDIDSLSYMAIQRAERAVRNLMRVTRGNPDRDALVAFIGAAWTDGFVAGVHFEQEGGHRG